MKRVAAAQLAGFLWLTGGGILIYRSIAFAEQARSNGATTTHLIIAIVLGLALGTGKGIFVLSKSARRNLLRLDSMQEPIAPWNIFPIYLFLLIPLMVGMGIGIRILADNGQLPGGWTTATGVYVGIGAALFASGTIYFKKKTPSA